MKLIILTSILSFSLFALDAKQIMQKVEDAGTGFEGSKAVLKMILSNAHGEKVERQLEATAREEKGGTKSITEFLTPKDVKGTKLLTWAFDDEDNKQWLYLPNLKRVKKINSSNKTSSFMGSEFSYEDIAGVELEAYKFELDKEDKEFWYITSTPKSKSGYKFIKTKVSKTLTIPVFVQYFDRRGGLLKESVVSDFQKYTHKGKTFNIPNKIVMNNVQTKKKSELIWESRKIGLKIKASQFKSSRLK